MIFHRRHTRRRWSRQNQSGHFPFNDNAHIAALPCAPIGEICDAVVTFGKSFGYIGFAYQALGRSPHSSAQAQPVKKGVAAAAGTPRECTITATDGIAPRQPGVRIHPAGGNSARKSSPATSYGITGQNQRMPCTSLLRSREVAVFEPIIDRSSGRATKLLRRSIPGAAAARSA